MTNADDYLLELLAENRQLHEQNESLKKQVTALKTILEVERGFASKQPCKYGNEPASCTSSPMDCQCALDAALEQPAQEPFDWAAHEYDGIHRNQRIKKGN